MGSKRVFFSLTALFSAKNGQKLKNGTFLECAVREFSENGFVRKQKLEKSAHPMKVMLETLDFPFLSLIVVERVWTK